MSPSSTIPPELTDTIIHNIFDPTTLRACSLVCHSWLPASRYHLYRTLSLRGDDIPSFLAHIQAPHNTFLAYLRRIELSFCENGPMQALVRLLPTFAPACLAQIRMESTMYYYDFPVLPEVTHLELWKVQFGSFAHFATLVARLPHLEHLKLEQIEWAAARGWAAVEELDLAGTEPPLCLDSLEFELRGSASASDDGDAYFDDWSSSAESCPRASSVVMSLQLEGLAPSRMSVATDYLRHTGSRLTSLHIRFHELSHVTSLDLSVTPLLASLRLTFRGNAPSSWQAYFSHIIPDLLERLPMATGTNPSGSATLQTLTIDVLAHYLFLLQLQLSPPLFERLTTALRSPKLAGLQSLDFYMYCAGHMYTVDEAGVRRLAEGHHECATDDIDGHGWAADRKMCQAERVFRRQVIQDLRLDDGLDVSSVQGRLGSRPPYASRVLLLSSLLGDA
ncbi:hypothetical protein C8F01DRAFT_1126371 [Mycena amicta]|nr:hypothetical protein C8F01DRAFT_1126371 [Mycena amicta]